jgi:hypothetical protein
MEYVVLFASGLGLIYVRRFRESYERYLSLKMFFYWLLSIITITIAGSAPLPLGIAIALFIYMNTYINRRLKLYSILCGLSGYVLSLIVFLIVH